MAITKRYYQSKKRKVIFYQAEHFSQGIRVSTKSFSKRKSAVLWLRHQIKNVKTSLENLDEMYFKVCMDRFFEDAKTRLAQSTFRTYSIQKKYLCDGPLGNLKMSELKGMRVVEWLSWLRTHSTAGNPQRKNFFAELKLLSTILHWYKNFINEDFNIPITKKHKKMCMFKQMIPRPMNYFIKPSDARKWVRWLRRNRRDVYWKLSMFMLSTGVRVGEACGLKWDDIDFEQGTARLVRKVKWNNSKKPSVEEALKTSSERLLILPKTLRKILISMRKKSESEMVFLNNKGEILKYSTIQSNFNAGFNALGLPWRSTHICRHTYATIALMTTKNLIAVQASLGHQELRTTQRYAKIVTLLNSNLGEKTFSCLFKNYF